MNPSKSFLYFAYGSNLLTKRIHIQNPTAVKKCIGELKDHRLDFIGYTERWKGSTATIVPHTGENVWGVVWEINFENLQDLDDQEGVSQNIYFPKLVDIYVNDDEMYTCRVYQKTKNPPTDDRPNFLIEKPSHLYISTITKGAKENHLPDWYIKKLESIPHNDFMGDTEIGALLK